MDLDLALRRLDGFAPTGPGVQGFAALLERRIDGRALADHATQRRQRRFQVGRDQRRHRPPAQHRPVSVVAVGGHAQHRGSLVGLARAEQQPGNLGGLAEAERQQAGGERIQAAGVPALLGAE